jgi:hypothetical protein
MARSQILKPDAIRPVARRARDDSDKAMKLAIVRYRHLKSLSANTADASEKAKFYEMALTCLANSAEKAVAAAKRTLGSLVDRPANGDAIFTTFKKLARPTETL